MHQKSIVNTSIMLMILAMMSKLLGIVREMLLAYYFGATDISDAYVVAQSCANFLVAGITGCVVTALIKSLVIHENNKEMTSSILKSVWVWLLILAGIFAGIILIKPNWIIRLFASGFSVGAKACTATILRFMAPLVILHMCSSVLNGYLQSRRIFLISGIGNIVLNIFIILGVFLGQYHIAYMGLGWSIGQFVLALITFFYAKVNGLDLVLGSLLPLNHPAIKSVLLMAAPLFVSAIFNEINPIVDRNFASMLAEGTVACLNYANRLNVLFTSLVVSSITTVLFPTLAKVLTEENGIEKYKALLLKTQNMLQCLAIPATVGILVIAYPVVSILYQRGAFDERALITTSTALRLYALYIPASTLTSVYVSSFNALGKTKAPAKTTILSLIVNVVCNFMLINPLGYKGLAVATVAANWVAAAYCTFALRKEIGEMGFMSILKNGAKVLVCSAVMGIAVYFANQFTWSYVAGLTAFIRLAALGLVVLLGVLVYLCACKALHVEAVDDLLHIVFKKLPYKRKEA